LSSNIRFISAGAGSGKTFRLTEELEKALTEGRAAPAGVVGTTFTNKAANELRGRVRQRLIESGEIRLANAMGQALLGTVNSVCGRLLERFAFEAGLPPELEVLTEEDGRLLFNQAVEAAIAGEDVQRMNSLQYRFDDKNDWRKKVKDIADAARANNMAETALAGFGIYCADDLLAFFPKPVARDLWRELEEAISVTIEGINAVDDDTKKTAAYLDFIVQTRPLVSEKRLAWSQWVKLSKLCPAKRCKAVAAPVVAAALRYDAHPELHADIRTFTETLFRLAAGSLRQYQEMKTKRGLIDFVDQEQLMLKAMDNETVRGALGEELDLLMVDEFQDTSPIQLAFFLKLAGCAKEAVFVGDVKQAIYGFRGSDPELMQAVLREVDRSGGQTDVLEKSWRSRPALVAYANGLFVPAFSKAIPQKQVELAPVREEKVDEPAVVHWVLRGSKKELRAAALARGVSELVASGYSVVDKFTNSPRSVRYEDIAVLARMNITVKQLADAMTAIGIPVQIERTGLLSTPEACLALACLRRMADPTDTLASAEIIALSDCREPEDWLQNRLEYLEAGHPGQMWGEHEGYEHEVIKALGGQRQRLQLLTPSEALSLAINTADLRRAVFRWGPAEWRVRQRLQNLDELVVIAGEYEDHCRSQHLAATVAGLILWLYELADSGLDSQPGAPKTDAVHVLTHHGAKGLEWPVVIATDLESDLKSRIWSVTVTSTAESVDLKNPLTNRAIRYWPWPFGGQRAGIGVSDQLESSPLGLASLAQEVEESKRLLYVSLTRARDLLVIPLPERKPAGQWMGTLGADWMLPIGDVMDLPNGNRIPSACCTFDAAEAEAAGGREKYRPFWFGPRKTKTEKLPALVVPSAALPAAEAKVDGLVKIGVSLKIGGSPEMDRVGQAVHGAIALEMIHPNHPEAVAAAKRLIDTFELAAHISPDDVAACAKIFRQQIVEKFQPEATWVEHPVEHLRENGQIVRGWIDFLIKTEKGWVVIDHKTHRGKEKELEREALKYSGQLLAYKTAVEAATGEEMVGCWIHFPLAGGMCSIKFE
jgi:ATP-dependent exoDNAse (exonuclease V) beta subunit